MIEHQDTPERAAGAIAGTGSVSRPRPLPPDFDDLLERLAETALRRRQDGQGRGE